MVYHEPVPLLALRKLHERLELFPWYVSFVSGDLYAISGNAVLVGEDVINAECCNITAQTPSDCFIARRHVLDKE